MKKILILLAFFYPLAINAYYGDVQNFIVEENSICLDAPEEASKSYISEESSVSKNAQWSTQITLSFSPTSSNYLKWFIMADSANVNASSNGYYLLLGGIKRTLSFYCQKNGKSTLIHQEEDKLLDNSYNNVKIDIKRDESDYWVLEYILNDTLANAIDFYDSQVNFSSFWGWYCVYTKTRSKSFCFANNVVEGEKSSAPRVPKEGELLINEVLFNPIGDGVDFVEIYNASDTVFDLSICQLGNKKQIYTLPYYILQPDSFVAITNDSAILCSQYQCKIPINILQVDKMLPLPNDSGYIRLIADTILLDSFSYNANMHHVLLDNAEGVSLERSEDGTWHSTSTVLQATPGYKNSSDIHLDANVFDSESEIDFVLNSSVVSVYNLETLESVILRYRLRKQSRVTVKIYTLSGYSVYTIIESELLNGEGNLYWDGRSENSGILPVGMYVMLIEIYDENGKYMVEKLPVAIVP